MVFKEKSLSKVKGTVIQDMQARHIDRAVWALAAFKVCLPFY